MVRLGRVSFWGSDDWGFKLTGSDDRSWRHQWNTQQTLVVYPAPFSWSSTSARFGRRKRWPMVSPLVVHQGDAAICSMKNLLGRLTQLEATRRNSTRENASKESRLVRRREGNLKFFSCFVSSSISRQSHGVICIWKVSTFAYWFSPLVWSPAVCN